MSISTDTTADAARATAPGTDADDRRRHRDEARLIRTREAAARKDTASNDGQWALATARRSTRQRT